LGILFVISAPSGAGKTSILKSVLAADSGLELSISHTTRARRSGEVDGVDYNFVTKEHFQQMIKDQDFIEYAEVFGNYYGTAKSAVAEQLASKDLLLELDWQGALSIKALYPDAVWVFILPPTVAELEARLVARSTNSSADIALRLAQAKADMAYASQSDYIVVNTEFAVACSELLAIIQAERLRSSRQKHVIDGIIN